MSKVHSVNNGLTTGGLLVVARLDHKVNCGFLAGKLVLMNAAQDSLWKVLQVCMIIFKSIS